MNVGLHHSRWRVAALARIAMALSFAAPAAVPVQADAKATDFRAKVVDLPAIVTRVEIGSEPGDTDVDIYLRAADGQFWDAFWWPTNQDWIGGLADALQQTRGKYSRQCQACAGTGADGTQCTIDANAYYESNPCRRLLSCRECIWDLDRNYDRWVKTEGDPTIADFTAKAEVFYGNDDNRPNDELAKFMGYLLGPADDDGLVCDERGAYDDRTRTWSYSPPSPSSACGRRILVSGVVTADQQHDYRMEIHPVSSIVVPWGPDVWRVGAFIDGSEKDLLAWWSTEYRSLPEWLYPSTVPVPLSPLQGHEPSAPGTAYTPFCFVNELGSFGVRSKSVKPPASLGRCPATLNVSMDRASGSGAGWLGVVAAGWSSTHADLAVAMSLETPGGLLSRGAPREVPPSSERGPSGTRALAPLPSSAGAPPQPSVYRAARDLFPTRPSRVEPRCEIAQPPRDLAPAPVAALAPPAAHGPALSRSPPRLTATSKLSPPTPIGVVAPPSAVGTVASPTASGASASSSRLPAPKELPPLRRWYAWKVEARLSTSSSTGSGQAEGLTWAWSIPPEAVMVPAPPPTVKEGAHEFTLWVPADPRGLEQDVFARATVRRRGASLVEAGDAATLEPPTVHVAAANPRIDTSGGAPVYRISASASAKGFCGDAASLKYAWKRNGVPVPLSGPGPQELTLDPSGRPDGHGGQGPELLTVTVSDPYGAQSAVGELEVRAPQLLTEIAPSCAGGLRTVAWTPPPGFSGAPAAPPQRAIGSGVAGARTAGATRSLCDKVQLLSKIEEADVGVAFPKETDAGVTITWSDVMYASSSTGNAWEPVPQAWRSLSRADHDGDRLTIATGGAEKMHLQAAVQVVDRLGRTAIATVELTNDFTPVQDLGEVVEHLWRQWRPGQPLPPVAGTTKATDPLAAEVGSLLGEASRKTTRDPLQVAALRNRLDRLEQYGFAKTASARGVALKRLARPVFTIRTRSLAGPGAKGR